MQTILFTPIVGTMVMGATILSPAIWAAPAPSGRPQKLASPDAGSGRSYTIESAPAVTGPWATINTQSAPASGLLEYLDAPTPPGSAFYRTMRR